MGDVATHPAFSESQTSVFASEIFLESQVQKVDISIQVGQNYWSDATG